MHLLLLLINLLNVLIYKCLNFEAHMSNEAFSKVSIIIPCYNQAKYVACAIESALCQTYKNIEIVIVDDCSSDNSVEVIKNYAKNNKNIKYLTFDKNKGVCAARNAAIDASSGKYILPLDADDIIAKTYVQKAVEILEKKPDIGIVYCNARMFGKINKKWILPEFNKECIIFTNCIFNSAMYRKSDFILCGAYDENMRYGCEDWDLWLSFIEKGFGVYKINEELFYYRKLDEKTRTDLSNKHYSQICREIFNKHRELYFGNQEFYKRVFMYNKSGRKFKKILKLLLLLILFAVFVLLCLLSASFYQEILSNF